MNGPSRREFLGSAAAFAVGVSSIGTPWLRAAAAEPEPLLLSAVSRTIEVMRKPAKVFGLQANEIAGIFTETGRFRVRLRNDIGAPTLIHWHGLQPPFGQDGVPDLPQRLLPSGQSYNYDFPLSTPGTHWMHAHTLQEQQLLAAPLIVAEPGEGKRDEQPVVVLLHDFSFRSPEEIFQGLKGSAGSSSSMDQGMSSMPGMKGMAMPGMAMPSKSGGDMKMDVNDVDYDAYLANDRSLDDPAVFRVEPGGAVRLRLINGATATAFWIDLGELPGEAIAVDGNPIKPVAGRRFPLAMGQRIDILLRLPKSRGAWPILALREGAVERTGFVLATQGAAVRHVSAKSTQASGVLDLALEGKLRAAQPLVKKPATHRETVVLAGDMASYSWTLDGKAWGQHRALKVGAGDRVEVLLRNDSMMGHPMHLHGHHFAVVAIDGKRFEGAVRDTVWVPPMRAVSIAFDANNPGQWAFHCHHLYHMAAGMMTVVDYSA